ncbi:MAG TPA: solute carrier family 23 protein [Acholeplasmataceae bacterium]|nr:solute carrier family 23 protein [Acholeplasmataceae bacterium]HRX44759.1 solute carrier family 23 protein [Acholeplasmataceae bacterium]
MNENGMIVGIQEKPASIGKWIILSLQHVFAMFGATVLVPLLTGLDVGVALVASGIGTLIYILCTKAKVPVYLGSSFAYIPAITAAVASAGGAASAYFGLMTVGLIYVIVAIAIHFAGSGWLKKLLPPVVIGPMIIIIGMTLAPVAISSSGFDGSQGWEVPLVAAITFLSVVILSTKAKGFLRIVPFLVSIFIGYVASIAVGLVDLGAVFSGVQFFQLPNFSFVGTYKFDLSNVLMFAPLAFVTIAEHIGDHVVLGEITGKDFITDPGLDKTLLGDGIATFVAGAIGGPANTTYGENTGVVAITRVGSVWVTGLAACFAILLGFFGYIQAFINSIPWAVIGGMTIVLYGLIAANGVKILIKDRTDLGNMKNLIIVSTMLVIGLGGAVLNLTSIVKLSGMSFAAIVGILLNLFINLLDKIGTKKE